MPVVLEGEAKAVTAMSGMVDQTMFALTVLSKPDSIPTELTVDISELEVGEAIHVSDVSLPTGVRTEVEGEETIATALVTRSTLEAMRIEEEGEAAALLEGEEGEAAEGEGGEGGDSEGGEDAGDES